MRWLLLIALALPLLAQEASFTNGRPFHVQFDYDPLDTTQTVYRVHQSANISLPVEQWQEFETGWYKAQEGTNAIMVSSNTVSALLPMSFYVVSSSNEWGRVFSEAFATAPPRQGRNLRLR